MPHKETQRPRTTCAQEVSLRTTERSQAALECKMQYRQQKNLQRKQIGFEHQPFNMELLVLHVTEGFATNITAVLGLFVDQNMLCDVRSLTSPETKQNLRLRTNCLEERVTKIIKRPPKSLHRSVHGKPIV